jgi:hypothetical protein
MRLVFGGRHGAEAPLSERQRRKGFALAAPEEDGEPDDEEPAEGMTDAAQSEDSISGI